ncbi:MAG: hypothetical protein LBG58_15805 [Planctomycetaceae bacterium]|jgi:hypothetical protein|nr:hypothetical protein [Planctomycetaceae bacterium]
MSQQFNRRDFVKKSVFGASLATVTGVPIVTTIAAADEQKPINVPASSHAESAAPVPHLFLKLLNAKGIQFPTTKREILTRLGESELRLSKTNRVKAADFVRGIVPEHFENGSAFWSAFHSALYGANRDAFLKARK